MTNSSLSNCPVPTEQQPLNEYEELKSTWLFRDCTRNWLDFLKTMAWIWGFCWLLAAPVTAASFSPYKQLSHFLLCSAAGASIGVVLCLVRLYLGWSYVSDRLFSSVVFYEESGWYDGQTWTKPEKLLTRDRLIVSYEIKPIIRRLQNTFAGLAGLFVAGTIVWHLV
ncbi:CGLD27 family protein [Calothrix rhizosoleniae]|uniref:CGLD27 family protein n=1 Tax=Calothrix rhizosoleniae TaxID=888997 RepID=UPI000B4A0B14|nr:CGLD27 family protein [Calothrix rhizosoleniae]